ncbi:unnamed protein product [Eruca vesicaria subsp. sativa]|uniref:Uncharacterized protein n=1 Tax=Eruca vesicaria subsp. sativa TaxID=29727 RepID=A0ABC8LSM6_ERUVS|nr:unnamed protein product [Eruca vesicaria subsp. sativa]
MTIHTKHIIRVWDHFMTPDEEAKVFGIINEVIDERPLELVKDVVGDEIKDKSSS